MITTGLPASVVTDSWIALNVLDPKYGAKGDGVTDDTVAVQGAINAASAQAGLSGIADVWLPSGYGFKLNRLTPKSGVRLWCYGAFIKPDFANMGDHSLFETGAVALSQWAVLGGTWDGSNATTVNQQLLAVSTNGSIQAAIFKELYCQSWVSSCLYLRNANRVRVLDSDFIATNTGTFGGYYNTVNFVGDVGGLALQYLLARGNFFTANKSASIAVVNNQTAGSGDMKALITKNISVGDATSTSSIAGAIDFESTSNGMTYGGLHIIDNDVEFTAANTPPNAAMNFSCNGTSVLGELLIQANRIKSTSGGIRLVGVNNEAQVLGNRINTPAGLQFRTVANPFRSGNVFSSGPSSGTATLVAGTVTVNTAEVQAGDRIILSRTTAGGTLGHLSVGTITAATSFVINSSSATDTSTVFWRIDH